MDYVEVNRSLGIYDFSGGMRGDVDASKLDPNQYHYLQNGRVRFGSCEAIKLPLDVSKGLPNGGNLQGLYFASNTAFVFIDGKVYQRDFADDTDEEFNNIGAFNLNADAKYIYTQLVPASTINFRRQADNANDAIRFTENGSSTPSAMVCQDGINQPVLILNITNVRNTSNIDQWTLGDIDTGVDENREYVPIGKNMLYYDGVLYVISPDGKEIYRSVTGRPLDFVIAVDAEGNKLEDLPSNGIEASRMSHRVDYGEIVCINNILLTNSLISRLPQDQKSGFFVASKLQSYLVSPNKNFTLYSEPYLTTLPLFSTSPVNQFTMLPMLGDVGFIDAAGLKSIESIMIAGEEGRNLEFSSSLSYLFKDISQDDCCCANSDDYAYFCVKTKFGYKVIIYDTLTKVFVSVDDYSNIDGHIKWITPALINNKRRIFVGTSLAKVYELDASAITAERILFTKEWTTEQGEYKPQQINVALQDNKEAGLIYATEFVDRAEGIEKPETNSQSISADTDEFITPYGNVSSDGDAQSLEYGIVDGVAGGKVSVKIQTSVDTTIQSIAIDVMLKTDKLSFEQAGKAYTT